MQEQKPVTTALVTCSLTNKAHHIDHVGCFWHHRPECDEVKGKKEKEKVEDEHASSTFIFFLQNQDCLDDVLG